MSSQVKTGNYGLCQYGDNDIPDWRTDYTGDMAVIDEQLKARADGENLINKEVTTLKQELEETKKSVSDGKSKVASAITEKGVATEATDTFDTMAENIEKISGGGVVSNSNSTKGTFSDAYIGITQSNSTKGTFSDALAWMMSTTSSQVQEG